jgi:peptidoglycan L-alanyl-D-glutamate endopeptidase CwlK
MKFNGTRLVRLVSVLALLHLTSCAQSSRPNSQQQAPISDSALSLKEALGTQDIPGDIRSSLALINVDYYSFDGKLHRGQLVIRKDLQNDVLEVFNELKKNKFPICKVIPISQYKFSDPVSMAENNTSGFNYRVVEGTTKLSNHALGRAIDINPLLNPYIRNGTVEPLGAKYDPSVPGTIVADGIVVKAFKERGWTWGGDWNSLKDYQHFERLSSAKHP